MELKALGNELASGCEVASIDGGVSEAQEQRRDTPLVVQLAEELEARRVGVLGQRIFTRRVARASEHSKCIGTKLERQVLSTSQQFAQPPHPFLGAPYRPEHLELDRQPHCQLGIRVARPFESRPQVLVLGDYQIHPLFPARVDVAQLCRLR